MQRLIVFLMALVWSVGIQAEEIKLMQKGDDVFVTLGGKPFTTYLAKSGTKPALHPVFGPGQVAMTRSFPIKKDVEGERTDHPHHRSLWFTHGDVNGIDFWTEPNDKKPKRHGFGRIIHKEYLEIESGDDAHLIVRSEWQDSKDKPLLSDYRRIGFGADENRRWIDFDIHLYVEGDKSVKFGDTKEGCFGVRVASWMAVDAKSKGRIVNSVGDEDKAAWGKATSWVDYHGEYQNRDLGIAILNHPSSFRFPTYWHVRTYGLFAANVFGVHNFKNSDDVNGEHELKPGESLMFCYRVLLHSGDEQKGRVPESFVEYAKVDKLPMTREDFEADLKAKREAAAIAAATHNAEKDAKADDSSNSETEEPAPVGAGS